MGQASASLARLMASGIKNTDIDWEQVLRLNYCALLDRGANYVDVGGHKGSHAICFLEDMEAANLAIFEPIPVMLDGLKERFSDRRNVKIFPYALSNERTNTLFQWKPTAPAESGLARKNHYSDGATDNIIELSVEIVPLDEVGLSFAPDFIKIDIEGGEINMLRGASKTVRTSRPIISAEYGSISYEAFGHTAGSLPEWARDNGYDIYDLLGNRFDDGEFVACVDRYYWDYLLVPSEKSSQLAPRLDIVKRMTRFLPMTKWRETDMDIISRV